MNDESRAMRPHDNIAPGTHRAGGNLGRIGEAPTRRRHNDARRSASKENWAGAGEPPAQVHASATALEGEPGFLSTRSADTREKAVRARRRHSVAKEALANVKPPTAATISTQK